MIDVKETLNSAAERMEMAAMYLAEELSHIRAGRANVAISTACVLTAMAVWFH